MSRVRAVVGWAGTWPPGEHRGQCLQTSSHEWRPQADLWISDVVPSIELADCEPLVVVNGVTYPLRKHPTKAAWFLFDHKEWGVKPRSATYRFGTWYLPAIPGDVVTLTVRNPTGFPIDGGVQLFGVDHLEDDSWQDS